MVPGAKGEGYPHWIPAPTPLFQHPLHLQKGRWTGAAGLAGSMGVSPSTCTSQHEHCGVLGGAVPSLLLSSPISAARGW